MLTHQLVADMKRDSASKRLPLAVCASRNGGPQTYDCARYLFHFFMLTLLSVDKWYEIKSEDAENDGHENAGQENSGPNGGT